MKVKITKTYNDLQLKQAVKKGEFLTVGENRAKQLIDAGVAVEYIEEAVAPAEEAPKPPKKKAKKKE